MGRFEDRMAIVTGAGSGLGAAIATRLAGEGASVVCVDLTNAAARQKRARAGLSSPHREHRAQRLLAAAGRCWAAWT
jgi:meso-butanediol dehydrogenase/(S,S)-butanediol dehydrogenase/diacetyl reductase